MDSWHLACCGAPWEHSIRPDVTSAQIAATAFDTGRSKGGLGAEN